MIFEWDETKNLRTLAERGFDFAYAAQVFADPGRLERVDTRRDYGEERRQTIGEVDGRVFFVAFTHRGPVIRIIWAKRAHDHEEKAYREGGAWR
ncbi:MAG: BrnT family toxin [Alphaproteobacteria bacterium]|nr:BrnT family toxin [Alphaproteobacteria bacterium]